MTVGTRYPAMRAGAGTTWSLLPQAGRQRQAGERRAQWRRASQGSDPAYISEAANIFVRRCKN